MTNFVQILEGVKVTDFGAALFSRAAVICTGRGAVEHGFSA